MIKFDIKLKDVSFKATINSKTGLIKLQGPHKNIIHKGLAKWIMGTEARPKNLPLWIPYEPIKKSAPQSILVIDSEFVCLNEDGSYYIIPSPVQMPNHLNSRTSGWYYYCDQGSCLINFVDQASNQQFSIFILSGSAFLLQHSVPPHKFGYQSYLQWSPENGNITLRHENNKNYIFKAKLSQAKKVNCFSERKNFVAHIETPKILNYTSCIDFLNDHFHWKKDKSKQWSFLSWSKTLGLKSNTSILKICKKQRTIGHQIRNRLASYFEFNEEELSYFCLLVEYYNNSEDQVLLEMYSKLIQTFNLARQDKTVTDRLSWFEFKLNETSGVVTFYNKYSDIAEAYFSSTEKGIFTFLSTGKPRVITSNESNVTLKKNGMTHLQNTPSGINVIGNKIIWFNKIFGHKVLTVDNYLLDYSDNQWLWDVCIKQDQALLVATSQIKERQLIFIFNKENVYFFNHNTEDFNKLKSLSFKIINNQAEVNINHFTVRLLLSAKNKIKNYLVY